MNKNLLIIPNNKEVASKVDNYTLLFPLHEYSIGFKNTYTFSEIENNSYIYINRLLNTKEVEDLKELLKNNKEKIKALVFEDIGLIEIIKDINLDCEKILFASHALCSSKVIDSFLDYVDSAVISYDLTKEEIEYIINNTNNTSLYLFGRIPYMYSRRQLLTNYQTNFNLDKNNEKIIHEDMTDKNFYLLENEYGTIIYDDEIYDARELMNESVKYGIINLDGLDYSIEDVLANKKFVTTSGFLNKKTIYKLPEKEA